MLPTAPPPRIGCRPPSIRQTSAQTIRARARRSESSRKPYAGRGAERDFSDQRSRFPLHSRHPYGKRAGSCRIGQLCSSRLHVPGQGTGDLVFGGLPRSAARIRECERDLHVRARYVLSSGPRLSPLRERSKDSLVAAGLSPPGICCIQGSERDRKHIEQPASSLRINTSEGCGARPRFPTRCSDGRPGATPPLPHVESTFAFDHTVVRRWVRTMLMYSAMYSVSRGTDTGCCSPLT